MRAAFAAYALEHGWLLTPLAGKHPTLSGWESAPAPSPAVVEAWTRRGNVGLRTGAASGVVVVDVDSAKGGAIPEALATVTTPTVLTGGGGFHLYFACPEGGLRNSAGRLGHAVDVRGDGGQVVTPGGVHPETGRVYEWAPGLSAAEVALAELPADVVEVLRRPRARAIAKPRVAPEPSRPASTATSWAVTRYGERALWDECEAVRRAAPGTRNDRLNRAAFACGQLLAGGHLSDEAFVVSQLEAAAHEAGLEDHEVGPTIRSGLAGGLVAPRTTMPDPRASLPATGSRTPPPSSRGATREPGEDDDAGDDDVVAHADYHLTDLGNAQRLANAAGHDLRHAEGFGWLRWDGLRWERVEDGKHVARLAHDVTERIITEAGGIADPEVAKKVRGWGLRSQSAQRLSAMVNLAATLSPIAAQAQDFDGQGQQWRVVTLNGTLDLGTGVIRPSERGDLVTRRVAVRYDPDAPCPLWESFLLRIFDGDRDLIDWLQRACGYTLTGSTREQVMFLCYGALGQNGKSTFLGTVRYVMGELARHADFGSFLARSGQGLGGQARGDLARLTGARLVTAVEPDEWARFSESTVKAITGGDPITARFMYEREFEYVPTFKLWMAANHKPRVSGTDLAFWRRMRLVPFLVRIPAEERDRDLEAKLREEAVGIFAWIVRGAREWLDRGLDAPEKVDAATREYREENDLVGQFIGETCDEGETCWVNATRLYRAFKAWQEEQGEAVWSQTRFGRAMAEKGYKRERTASSTRETVYLGLDLRLMGAAGGGT